MRQPQVPGPVYGVQYDVYKGKAAVQFKPIKATVEASQSGSLEVKRKGVLLMEFANATGQRQYDWGNKIYFALSVTEMSQVFLTNTIYSNTTVELFHDPSMRGEAQGQVLA